MAKLTVGLHVEGFQATLELQTTDIESHSLVTKNMASFQSMFEVFADDLRKSLGLRVSHLNEEKARKFKKVLDRTEPRKKRGKK